MFYRVKFRQSIIEVVDEEEDEQQEKKKKKRMDEDEDEEEEKNKLKEIKPSINSPLYVYTDIF